jgi:hypothetical protein
MEFNKYFTKNKLISICIIIIILIIVRIFYNELYNNNNNNIESFTLTETLNKDLLSKYKSTNAQEISDSNNTNTEMQIMSWSNKIYNMQNTTQQSKAIAFYKPNLLLNNNVQYCKLGDMVSQNTDYSLPNADQFTLLVKKIASDIKPPVRFDLVVDIGYKNFDNKYYTFDKYIDNTTNINNISTSLLNCSNAIDNLNLLIQNNMKELQTNFTNYVYDSSDIQVFSNKISISKIISTNNQTINVEGFTDAIDSGYTDFLTPLSLPVSPTNTTSLNINEKSISANNLNYRVKTFGGKVLRLPAGIVANSAQYSTTDKNYYKTIDINIPSNLDSVQNGDKTASLKLLPLVPLGTLPLSKIEYDYKEKLLFDLIPSIEIVKYIKALCTDIQNIYTNQPNNTLLLSYLNLTSDITKITSALNKINSYMINNNNNLDNTGFTNTEFSNIINDTANDNQTLLGLILNIIKNMKLSYNLTYLKFETKDIGMVAFSDYPIDFSIYGFNNNIIPNINLSKYNIKNTSNFTTGINNVIPKITSFATFISNFSNNTMPLLPLQIYKPIAPDNYTSLGHVFCNVNTDLQKIIDSKNVACIPSHCIKEIRDWNKSDKIFEYNKDNKYFAIYYNPYTGTFISTNTNSQQLPSGKVCKVVACVKKCDAVEKLQKADECTRKYYNLNKKLSNETKLSSTIASDQEEIFYLDKIKAQSDSISKLTNRAQQMQTSIDKATIVNREMNKNKLQDYVDTQKRNIDIIMKKLQDDKNKIETNINVPSDTLKAIIQMIKDSEALSAQQKQNMIKKIIDTQNNKLSNGEYNDNLSNVLNSCPQYDLEGLVKKTQVSDVCYGCDNPQ